MRPGEKIHEELLIGEESAPSEHPRIRRAMEERFDHERVESLISDLKQAVSTRDSVNLRRHLAEYGNLRAADEETTV